ncbi:hypothetical protein Tco_1040617 [Tanacetum coccineum]
MRSLRSMTLNVSCCLFGHVRVFLNYTLLCAHALPVSLCLLNVPWTWLFVLPWSVLSLLLDRDLAIGNEDSPHYHLHLRGLVFIQQLLVPLDDALCVFNTSMEIDFLSNPSEIAALKLMKKMANIYFTHATKDAESTFSLYPRQMALWQSQREDHTSDWLRVVSISRLGQAMNACSKVFMGDTHGDHAVSCAGIIGTKHRYNAMRNTLVDICFRSGISADKEVDIGLGRGCDKALHPADMLLYSWDGGLYRKRDKYMAKCAAIGYGFLPFSFSSLGELEADAVTLLKRIQKFSMTQDIRARAAIHIFNRITFAIAKEIVDFLEASHIKYALTVHPTVYVSHIQQFWSTARVDTLDGETKIIAKINGRQRTVTESSIRRHLKLLDDEDETASPTRDDRHGEAFPIATSLDAGQDRENITKTSAMPHEASPGVTSLGGGEGSMQQKLQELMDMCTHLQ